MNYPEDLKYTKSDEWVRVDGDVATIGISDYAQDQLSDVVYLEIILSEGEAATQGDSFGTVESVKAAADIYLPVSGTIVAVNDSLQDAPESINSDPYGESWMIQVQLTNPAELDELMDHAAYAAYCDEREG